MGIRDLFRRPVTATTRTTARFGQANPATGMVVGSGPNGAPAGQQGPARQERWQHDLWPSYDAVGEFHAATTFVGSCFARTRISLGLLVDDDKAIPLYDDDGNPEDGIDPGLADTAARVLATLRPATGGQARLLEPAGKNIAGPAEFWLLGQDTLDSAGQVVPGARTFEVCSSSEIVPSGRSYIDPTTGERRPGWARRQAPGATPVDLPPTAFLLRTHRPHPQWSALADSPVKALLPVLDRMRLLTAAGRSEAMSRLAAAGVLWVPEELDWPEDDTADGTHPLQRQLVAALSTSIRDPDAAGAYTPYVVTAAGDKIAQIRHDRFDRPEFDADGKRDSAVAEFARGIDLPPEQVTGLGKSTHWNASTIDEATYKAYILPPLELVLESWTAGFLRPQIGAAYGATLTPALAAQLARIVLHPDASALILHPDREKAADVGYGTAVAPNFGVSGKTWRRAHGYVEGDGPDPDEIAERVRIAELLKVRTTAQQPGDAPQPLPDGSPPVPLPAPAAEPDNVQASALDHLVLLAAERAADRVASRCRDRARAAGHSAVLNGTPARSVVAALAAHGVDWQVEPGDLPPSEFTALASVARVVAAELGLPDPEGAARRAVSDAGALTFTLATRPG